MLSKWPHSSWLSPLELSRQPGHLNSCSALGPQLGCWQVERHFQSQPALENQIWPSSDPSSWTIAGRPPTGARRWWEVTKTSISWQLEGMNGHRLFSFPNKIFHLINPKVFHQSGGVSFISLLLRGQPLMQGICSYVDSLQHHTAPPASDRNFRLLRGAPRGVRESSWSKASR